MFFTSFQDLMNAVNGVYFLFYTIFCPEQQEVQIEFEAFPPQDNDFHGIKRLLQQLFARTKVNTSELTDLILMQNHVGCVIKQSEAQLAEDSDSDDDDDDEIFGFTTVLNITAKKNVACIQEIRSLVIEKCADSNPEAQVNELTQLLDDDSQSVGLLLSERFVNIPAQLAPPLHSSLQNDVRRAAAKNPHFKFDYILLLSKAYQQPSMPSSNKQSNATGDSSWLFANAEDELFFKESVVRLHYQEQEDQPGAVAGKWSEDDTEMKMFRIVMLVPAGKMNTLVGQIQEAFAL
ncbi:BRCA2 and CDKN1A-interacting protein-like [Diadema antillarum]|uniref:BRCA2 and CDKN1A-interacting protein-like n=2 Tax=Diadema antillarum TaxID=105358 RepID=UPI003A883DC2